MELTEDDLMSAYGTLVLVGDMLEADCCLIHKKHHPADGWMGIVMMRSRPDTYEALEIRVACGIPILCIANSNQALEMSMPEKVHYWVFDTSCLTSHFRRFNKRGFG